MDRLSHLPQHRCLLSRGPDGRPRGRPLWEFARWGFGAYPAQFAPYGHSCGPFGVVVASLVWIYVSAAIFLWGGELTALLTERAQGAERDAPPGRGDNG